MHIVSNGTMDDLIKADIYDIYQQCMYKPTYDAYKNIISEYQSKKGTKSFTCILENEIVGIMILRLIDNESAELIGIAVKDKFHNKGIGNYMLKQVARNLKIQRIQAETDDDAVGFYRKVGFAISKEIKHYSDGDIVRYNCVLHVSS